MAQQADSTDSEILLQDLGSGPTEWKEGYIDLNCELPPTPNLQQRLSVRYGLSDELPPVVKSAIDGTQATLQTAAVVVSQTPPYVPRYLTKDRARAQISI